MCICQFSKLNNKGYKQGDTLVQQRADMCHMSGGHKLDIEKGQKHQRRWWHSRNKVKQTGRMWFFLRDFATFNIFTALLRSFVVSSGGTSKYLKVTLLLFPVCRWWADLLATNANPTLLLFWNCFAATSGQPVLLFLYPARSQWWQFCCPYHQSWAPQEIVHHQDKKPSVKQYSAKMPRPPLQ